MNIIGNDRDCDKLKSMAFQLSYIFFFIGMWARYSNFFQVNQNVGFLGSDSWLLNLQPIQVFKTLWEPIHTSIPRFDLSSWIFSLCPKPHSYRKECEISFTGQTIRHLRTTITIVHQHSLVHNFCPQPNSQDILDLIHKQLLLNDND